MSTSKEYKAVRNCILNELHLTKEDIIKNIESLLEKLVKRCMHNTYGGNNQIENWIRCMVNDELKQRNYGFVERISKEEFDKINKKNKNPELTSINTFNDTVKKANEIKDRVLKCVYNIKQERSYNNDLVGIFERYKNIADGDMEVAMNFIKEAYPFNEETESFIRKKFDMPIPDESKEQ